MYPGRGKMERYEEGRAINEMSDRYGSGYVRVINASIETAQICFFLVNYMQIYVYIMRI